MTNGEINFYFEHPWTRSWAERPTRAPGLTGKDVGTPTIRFQPSEAWRY